MLRPSTSKTYFTADLGAATGLVRFGPLVVTFISPGAEIQVVDGHIGDDPADAPRLDVLRGADFRGEFFVEYGQSIVGLTKNAKVSGFYPYPDLPLSKNRHVLPCGASLFYNSHKPSNLLIDARSVSADELDGLKKIAIAQAQDLMCAMLEYDKWETLPDGKMMQLEFMPIA